MNIYLVERIDGGGGYDTYSDFVIVAKDSKQARSFKPSYRGLEAISGEDDIYGEWVTYDKTKATKIGEASSQYKTPTLICASFHAG